MDPEQAYKELVSLVEEINEIEDEVGEEGYSDEQSGRLQEIAVEQAQYFEALDGWLSKGGFLPAAWKKGR